MAGYDGYSKSNNAVDAEDEGRFPITKAARIVAKATGVAVKKARWVLTELGTDEFHHSSKFYNRIKYYDTKRAIDMILHGNPDYTDNLESEKSEAEYEIVKTKRAVCKHEWVVNRLACGLTEPPYCPKCGMTDYRREFQTN